MPTCKRGISEFPRDLQLDSHHACKTSESCGSKGPVNAREAKERSLELRGRSTDEGVGCSGGVHDRVPTGMLAVKDSGSEAIEHKH